jgi:hypothetical protein
MLRRSTAKRRAASLTAAAAEDTREIGRTRGALARTVTYLLPIYSSGLSKRSNCLEKLVTRVGIEPTTL